MDLHEQVSDLIGKGDYTTLTVLAIEWHGTAGQTPHCANGITRLCALTSALKSRVWRLCKAYTTAREITKVGLEADSVEQ